MKSGYELVVQVMPAFSKRVHTIAQVADVGELGSPLVIKVLNLSNLTLVIKICQEFSIGLQESIANIN